MTECCAQASVTFLGLARARGRSLTPGRSLQPKVNGGPHDWSVLGPMARLTGMKALLNLQLGAQV
jgi:hypothetical protein